MGSVTVFAPATVSNVGCGFDVLGFALDAPGDTVSARFTDGSDIVIEDISGDGGRLPREAARNTAGVAARSLLDHLGERRAVALTIQKGLPLAGGLGGSAASAVAAVVAVDALCAARSSLETLVACALDGERLGAGSAHLDNVAPALFGGLVLVRTPDPPEIVRLPVPPGLTAIVVHPALEIETARARSLLGDSVPLSAAIRQSANLGAFVDALHRGDLALLARTIDDAIAEPRRASLVPGLAEIKRAAIESGAVGAGLSGSGPSIFALSPDRRRADVIAQAMAAATRSVLGGEPQVYISPVATRGASVVSACGS